MTTHGPATDVALVVETNNLASADEAATVGSMVRLLDHLRAQTLPLSCVRELVVTHDGLSDAGQARMRAAADRPLIFVLLPTGTGYYEAKNLGFEATTAPIVVFGDADCWPDREWLRELVRPLSLGWDVAAGRTTYRDGHLGEALTSIDFMYFRDATGATTRNFYANNVAFRREIFDGHRYEAAPMYRGACQMLGMRLGDAGIAIRYVDAAHTVHRLPDDWREFVELRLRRGRDLRQLSPHVLEAALPAGRSAPLRPGRRLAGLVVAGRWLYSARHVGHHAGSVYRRAAQTAIMTAVTGVDTAGAMARKRRGVEGALSYHGNRDRLHTAIPDIAV